MLPDGMSGEGVDPSDTCVIHLFCSHPPSATRHYAKPESLVTDITFLPFVSYTQNFPYERWGEKETFRTQSSPLLLECSLHSPCSFVNEQTRSFTVFKF
jgi:hypothetical protein